MKLFIEESVYKDQNISVYGLSVYCALKTLIVTEEECDKAFAIMKEAVESLA